MKNVFKNILNNDYSESTCDFGHKYIIKNGCDLCFILGNDLIPVKKEKTKKEELIEALDFLKSKKVKTKQDKDSIYTLEMVLKNMK